eukprot:m.42592 g.42592  ORF g.42592 m.42592 type:complete len:282 (-) comp8343_c0_seq1:108-953(-)
MEDPGREILLATGALQSTSQAFLKNVPMFENHWRQVWVHSGELHNGRPRFQMEKNPAWWIYVGDDGHWYTNDIDGAYSAMTRHETPATEALPPTGGGWVYLGEHPRHSPTQLVYPQALAKPLQFLVARWRFSGRRGTPRVTRQWIAHLLLCARHQAVGTGLQHSDSGATQGTDQPGTVAVVGPPTTHGSLDVESRQVPQLPMEIWILILEMLRHGEMLGGLDARALVVAPPTLRRPAARAPSEGATVWGRSGVVFVAGVAAMVVVAWLVGNQDDIHTVVRK